jgi:hypothetical protein
MPETETTNFGTVFFAPESVFEFRTGCPALRKGANSCRCKTRGLLRSLFLQSLEEPSLCFTTLPIWVVDPRYRLHITEQGLEVLEFPACRVSETKSCGAVHPEDRDDR